MIDHCERGTYLAANKKHNVWKNRTGEEKQDTIRLHLMKRNSSQVVSTHKAPSQFKGTNGKAKKKHHARLPAPVPAFSVSRSPSGNNRQDRKDEVSAKKTGNIQKTTARANVSTRRKTVQSSATCGGKRRWYLGRSEHIDSSCAWQDDVKASVNNTWQISPFCHMLSGGAFVLDGTKGYHDKLPAQRQINTVSKQLNTKLEVQVPQTR